MRVIEEKPIRLQRVRVKSGALLWKITVSPRHFFLEQNPQKNSRFGVAYRRIKALFPDFYMFWEFKDGDYTGRLLTGSLLTREEILPFIQRVLREDESYLQYPDEHDDSWDADLTQE